MRPATRSSSNRMRAGAVDVPLRRAADVDALADAHPDIGREQVRAAEKGRRSPLAALRPVPETAAA